MTKADLILELRRLDSSIASNAAAEKLIGCFVQALETGLKQDGEAALPGLGKLKVKARAARKGRNPQTGEAIDIPATRVVVFSPAKGFNI